MILFSLLEGGGRGGGRGGERIDGHNSQPLTSCKTLSMQGLYSKMK